jgi:predicted AAA+ superfamily ATPase
MVLDQQKKDQIIEYIKEQIVNSERKIKAYTFDEKGGERPKRGFYYRLADFLEAFINKQNREVRLVVFTGLRGAGKTTLLAQLRDQYQRCNADALFLEVDRIVQLLEVSLSEFLRVYEEWKGGSFEAQDRPLILFLDEVQYDKKWGAVLKSIYDRTRNVFVLATGSSALALTMSADLARRAVMLNLDPLSFSEYLMLKKGKKENPALGQKIEGLIFGAANAKEVFAEMEKIKAESDAYLIDVNRADVDSYIRYGTLPFMITLNNDALVYSMIGANIKRIINEDLVLLKKFSVSNLLKIHALLYAMADAEVINATKIAVKLDVSRPVVHAMLDALEKTEAVKRIFPHGGHYSQINNPSKYLFASPAFRAMYYNTLGSIKREEDAMGKLLEDLVGMYLIHILRKTVNPSLTYDAAEGGADFIVSFGRECVIIEIGNSQKGFKQVKKTFRKVAAKYGLVIARDNLFLDAASNAIRIPLEMFLLAGR